MQDSLEDYIKLSRNTKQDEAIKISKEMVVTAQLKKECDARAMKIVEFSIEGKLRPEVFTRCLPFINQAHYQDIVEERAITKLCGYSLCGKRIPDMPKKQYFISTKSNKVYDITERKNFCSNFCYKASLHIKKQIDNSPLWLRKLEEIPEYKLLHISEGGLPGEYIDQGVVKSVHETQFTSISSFTQASLSDLADREVKPGNVKNNKTKGFKKSSMLKLTMQTIKENEVEEESQVISSTNETSKEDKRSTLIHRKESHHKISCVVSLPSIEEQDIEISENLQALRISPNEVIEETKESLLGACKNESDAPNEKLIKNKGERNKARKISKKKTNASKSKTDIETLIKKLMGDWLSLETCIFIYGEQKVKEILNENKLSDYFEQLNVVQLQREQQMKYMEICRRLQFQEMADEKFDNALTGGDKLKPLPDFRKLKEDIKDMNLKVTSFYQGGMYEKDDPNFPTKSSDKLQTGEDPPPAILPPVDAKSQHLLRRKIFLNSLNKTLHQLLQGLGVSSITSVLSDIQALVKTFNLKADNITFKPLMWNYIALTLLHLLSVKDQLVRDLLQEAGSRAYIDTFLGSITDGELLNDMVKNASQVEVFVEQYITKTEGIA